MKISETRLNVSKSHTTKLWFKIQSIFSRKKIRFYSGWKKYATIDKNESIKVRQRLLLDNAVKNNLTGVTSAWANLQSSESFLNSVRAQVKAAEIANEGITAEYLSGAGSRSTLDVIQSNSLLLNAKISLANSERNYLLAQYNLLKSVGLLTSNYLNLK